MRKTLLFIMLLAVLGGGCGKDGSSPTPTTPNNPTNPNTPIKPTDSNYMRYSVSGITDVTLDWKGEKTLVLGLAHTGGKQERTALSISNVPDKVTATIETPSGIPSFGTPLVIKASEAIAGTYTMTLKATTESDSVKTFPMKLTITGGPPPPPPTPKSCPQNLIGTFPRRYTCDGRVTYQSDQSAIVAASNGIGLTIASIPCYNAPITIMVDCATEKFTISSQSDGANKIGGSGQFFNNQKTVVLYMIITPPPPQTGVIPVEIEYTLP